MKRTVRYVLRTVSILFGGIMVGIVLLMCAFCVPVNEKNMSASYEIIDKEGWYPAIPIVDGSLDTYFHSYLPGVLDDATDLIMLSTALESQERNVLLASMDMNGYDYYWHGYVSVLRPLLFVFDYGEIRVLNGMLQLLLIVLLFLQIYRKKGMIPALVVLTSYYLLMSLAMPFSLQFSWVFYIAMGAALFLSSNKREQLMASEGLYWFFLIVGMCTSYFDLLTYPLFTWGFPLIWWIFLQENNKQPFYYVRTVVVSGLWWILGYGGLWLGKWLIGTLVLGRNIFAGAWYEVFFRLGAQEAGGYALDQRIEVLYTNWKHYEYKMYVFVFVVWLVWYAWQSIRKGICYNAKSKAYALIALSSVVWYLTLSNHTGGHHFFAYRIYGVSILAILAMLIDSVGEIRTIGVKRKCKDVFVWCACGVLACGLSLCAKEEVQVTNCDRTNNRRVAVVEGDVCTMRFTPTFPTVERIGICLETTSAKGECILSVWDCENILYQETIPLDRYREAVYTEIPVSWKLKGNYDYSMQFSFVGVEGDAFLLVTENMEMPIAEYGEVVRDDMMQGGQILSALSYKYRPLSKFTLGFLAITWCGILMAAYIAFVKKRDVVADLLFTDEVK